ncbi:hypothetical protein RHMOL_Rhmol11G0021200 [Rhododendron molle]|uniref:Uncharacterized protein n=1 Tax=Rhododendron molle TaxID=49168 RepID=A0ACC0LP23_RHOML|nr:hypothetical protein RHMOL_Rhmol11G0021200 [Rhododendron molle]
MQIFIESTNYDLWKIVANGPIIPTKKSGEETIPKLESEWTKVDMSNVEKNFRAMNLLFCAITPNEYDCVSACETAKEIWDKLKMAHEGDSQVKESKIENAHWSKIQDDSSDESEDDKIDLITKLLKKLLKNRASRKGKGFARKDGGKIESSNKDPIICYECKKPGHIKSECPYAKKYSKKDKRKAMMATWDNSDDSSSDEEDEQQEVANLCFMTTEETEIDLDSSYSFDELLVAYKELKVDFEKVVSKNKALKKMAKELSKEVSDLVEERFGRRK